MSASVTRRVRRGLVRDCIETARHNVQIREGNLRRELALACKVTV